MTRCVRLAVLTLATALTTTATAHATTVVSIQLDGALATQAQALQALEQRGMRGTLYVNSGRVGGFQRLTWDQLGAAARAGHEVGGFSVKHTPYTTMSSAEVRQDACIDRATIQAHGIGVTSFAYPFGLPETDAAPAIEAAVRSCGFDTARTTTVPDEFAESIPPVDPMATRAFQWDATHTLADLQAAVTNAEANGGGWIQYAFQEVCDGCDPKWSIPPATFTAFLDWLAARASKGILVRTPRQVLHVGGGPTADPTAPPPPAQVVGALPPGTTVPAPGGGTTVVRSARPAILSVRVARKRVRRTTMLTVRFRLNRDATIRVTASRQKVQRTASGKRVTRWVRTATAVTLQGSRGTNTRTFKARLLRLNRGGYRLRFVATDAAGRHSTARHARVTVVR